MTLKDSKPWKSRHNHFLRYTDVKPKVRQYLWPLLNLQTNFKRPADVCSWNRWGRLKEGRKEIYSVNTKLGKQCSWERYWLQTNISYMNIHKGNYMYRYIPININANGLIWTPVLLLTLAPKIKNCYENYVLSYLYHYLTFIFLGWETTHRERVGQPEIRLPGQSCLSIEFIIKILQ